jgi:hypothetical protein
MKVAKELRTLKKASLSKESKKQQAGSEYVARQVYKLLINLNDDEYYEYVALQTLSALICRAHGSEKWKDYIIEQLEKNNCGN